MLIIPIKDGENIDRALKRYKRKFDKTGVVRQLRSRQAFTKPSVVRRAEIQKAGYIQGLRDAMENQQFYLDQNNYRQQKSLHNFAVNGFFMVDSKQAYSDYLQKEKNYSPLTLRAYLDDIVSFEKFIKNRDDDAVLE